MAADDFFSLPVCQGGALLNLTAKIAFLSSLSRICFRKKSKNRW